MVPGLGSALCSSTVAALHLAPTLTDVPVRPPNRSPAPSLQAPLAAPSCSARSCLAAGDAARLRRRAWPSPSTASRAAWARRRRRCCTCHSWRGSSGGTRATRGGRPARRRCRYTWRHSRSGSPGSLNPSGMPARQWRAARPPWRALPTTTPARRLPRHACNAAPRLERPRSSGLPRPPHPLKLSPPLSSQTQTEEISPPLEVTTEEPPKNVPVTCLPQ